MTRRPASPRRRRAWRSVPLLAAGAVLLAACNGQPKQSSLDPMSHYARSIYDLFIPLVWVSAVILAIVWGGVFYFSARYRVPMDADLDAEELPPQVHGNSRLEVGWTILPALILVVVGYFTVLTIMHVYKPVPRDHPQIEVIGQQWWWEFRYDVNHDGHYGEIVTANEMVIPTGTDVGLHFVSRDVIHGFWAPKLAGKRDLVPGHPTNMGIAADKPGEYFGQCTVMCGLSHANMRFKVIALTPADYQKWLAHQLRPAAPLSSLAGIEKQGGQAFVTTCGMCHTIRGVSAPKVPVDEASGAAPNLTHLMTRTVFASGSLDLRKPTPRCQALGIHYADDPTCINTAALRAWLANPPGIIPMYPYEHAGRFASRRGMPNLNLSTQQIDQLTAYLTTLK